MEHVNPPGLPRSAGQSQVAITDARRTAYMSGQVALDADNNVVGVGDFRAQVLKVVENIDLALDAIGADRKDVVKLTIYVVNLDTAAHGPALGEALGDMSAFAHPAATLLSVAGLARPELLVEIEAVVALA